MKQMTIDGNVLDLEGRKHRNEQTYRETRQKTGEFTPRINQKNTEMIVGICKRNNLNKTKFVNELLETALSEYVKNEVDQMSEEEVRAELKRLKGLI